MSEPIPGSKRDQLAKKATYLPDIHRMLPQSTEAELGLLSALVLSAPEVGGMCSEKDITPEHFQIPAHGTVFRVLMGMWHASIPIDFIMLGNTLRDMGELDRVGGAAFVSSLFTFLPTAANAGYYLEILQEKFMAREIIALGTEFAARAYDEPEQLPALLDEFQGRVIELCSAREKVVTTRHIKTDCHAAATRYEARYRKRGHLDGLPTGFVDFDRTVNGLRGPNVYVIAARPAMGKTSFGTEIAAHVAQACCRPVTFFTIEMTRDQIVDRLVCSQASVSNEKLRRGFFGDADLDRIQSTLKQLADGHLWIDDSALTPQRFRALARKAVIQRKSELLVVDYIQLIGAGCRAAEDNDTVRVSQAMAAVVAVAKELHVPIILLAQLNRDGSTSRRDHRPSIQHLKQSGTIEEGAYLVGLLHRPSYYCKNEDERVKAAEECGITVDELDCYAELGIEKHRNGGVGTIKLRFIGEYTRFEGRTGKIYSNNPAERQDGGGREGG